MLVANKIDLPAETWEVNQEEILSFAESKGILFSKVSAKNGSGIQDMMMELTKTIDLTVKDEEEQNNKLENENISTQIFGNEKCC